jgi:hypothetical protein
MMKQQYEQAMKRTALEEIQQRRRVVECAIYLKRRIEPFASGGGMDENEYVCTCQEEAANISKGTFGDVFATAIDFALEVEVSEFIGSQTSFLGLDSQAGKWKKKGQSWGNQFKIWSSGTGAAKAYNELE